MEVYLLTKRPLSAPIDEYSVVRAYAHRLDAEEAQQLLNDNDVSNVYNVITVKVVGEAI